MLLHLQDCWQDHKRHTIETPANILTIQIPLIFFTDNSHLFGSDAFIQFMTTQRAHYNTSSPLYLKSNSFIERHIKTIKSALTTATASGTIVETLLINIHFTPIGPNMS